MPLKKVSAIFALILILLIAGSSFAAFAEDCAFVRENSVRLHIVAHSDSEADQDLKLALRDAILEAYSARLAGEASGAAADMARALCSEMAESARRFIGERGFDYPVSVSVVEMYFGTTHYEAFTMPAGIYTALRLEIGEAAGKNWWCVMYPPLCIPAASEGQAAEMGARIEALNGPVVYKPAFAMVEMAEKIRAFFEGETA